jgi:hypothetical protein
MARIGVNVSGRGGRYLTPESFFRFSKINTLGRSRLDFSQSVQNPTAQYKYKTRTVLRQIIKRLKLTTTLEKHVGHEENPYPHPFLSLRKQE